MTGDHGSSGKRPEVGDALVAALGFEPATRVADRDLDQGRGDRGMWPADDGPQIIPDPPPPSAGDAAGSAQAAWSVADGHLGGTPAPQLDLRPTAEVVDSMSPPKGKGKGPQKFDRDQVDDDPLELLPDTRQGVTSAARSGETEAVADRNGNGFDPASTVVAEGVNGEYVTGEYGNGEYADDEYVDEAYPGRPIEGFDYDSDGAPLFPDDELAAAPPPAATAAATGELTIAPLPEPDVTGPHGGDPAAMPSPARPSTSAFSRGPSSINANAAVAKAGELAQRMPQLLEEGLRNRSHRVRARKVRRVVRHVDPWSVLTFSVLFHLCVFASLLLASVLVWNAAVAAGTIENIENFIRELGDYETFEIKGDVVFRAAMVIAGILTLASSVLAVLLSVVFNLISDLVGGIRLTVVEEETVRVRRRIQ